MDRRKFLTIAVAASLSLAMPFSETEAAGETTALIKLMKSAKSDDFSTIGPIAQQARKIGWDVPTTGSQVKLVGPWKYTTWKGEKGTVEFMKGGGLRYGGSSRLPFTSWEIQTSSGKPALLFLTGPGKTSGFQYFQRPGIAAISNLSNRSQWLLMTVNR